MKAAVFAALATTAAAFAPVARPLAAAAATKLGVVPETVAELPSMLTALPTLTAPQEGELFFTSPFFVAFFVLSSAFGWPVLAWLASIVQRFQERRRTKRRFCSPGASTNATRYYLELLRQYLVRNRAELGKLAPHPATSAQRDAEIERFVASGQSLHSYRLTY